MENNIERTNLSSKETEINDIKNRLNELGIVCYEENGELIYLNSEI